MLQTATRKILVVTRRWPKEVELRIARDYEPRINLADRFYSSDELINVSKGADALLITGQDRMDADVISRLPGSVRVIAKPMWCDARESSCEACSSRSPPVPARRSRASMSAAGRGYHYSASPRRFPPGV